MHKNTQKVKPTLTLSVRRNATKQTRESFVVLCANFKEWGHKTPPQKGHIGIGIDILALAYWHWHIGIGRLALADWQIGRLADWQIGILALADWHWQIGILVLA